jgi:uncharacterized protein (DUF885 family)
MMPEERRWPDMKKGSQSAIAVLMFCLAALLLGGCRDRPVAEQLTTEAVQTPTDVTGVTGLEPDYPDGVEDLQGLDLDEFFEASYINLLLRDPELVTEIGLSEEFGIGNDRLTDISSLYQSETQELEAAILDLLDTYEETGLSPEQELSVEVYTWYLDDLVRGHEYMYKDYPVTHFITGVQNGLVQFFNDIHPITGRQDAQDYIERLSQVDTKFDQLIEGLRIRESAGVVLPKFIIQWVLRDLRNMARSSPRATPFYKAFSEKIADLDGLTDTEREELLEAAEKEVGESVIPGFQSLVTYFEGLESNAPNNIGVWTFSDGEAYYEYALRHHTTTEMTVDEIHQLGLQELDRIHAEMRVLFDELGYPQDESLQELFGRVTRDSGT